MVKYSENSRFEDVSFHQLKTWVDQIKTSGLFDYLINRLSLHMEQQSLTVLSPESEFQKSCELLGMHTLKVAAYCDGVKYVKGVLNDIEKEIQRRVDESTRREADAAKKSRRNASNRKTSQYTGESHTGIHRGLTAEELQSRAENVKEILQRGGIHGPQGS